MSSILPNKSERQFCYIYSIYITHEMEKRSNSHKYLCIRKFSQYKKHITVICCNTWKCMLFNVYFGHQMSNEQTRKKNINWEMYIFTIWVKARFVTANDCRNCWQFERTFSLLSPLPPQHKHKMKHFICILNFHVPLYLYFLYFYCYRIIGLSIFLIVELE